MKALLITTMLARIALGSGASRQQLVPLSRRSVTAMNDVNAAGTCNFELQGAEAWYWGADSPTVNLTIVTDDNPAVKLLSLERLAPCMTRSSYSRDTVHLEFHQGFNISALRDSWTWVNNAESQHVVLVNDTGSDRQVFNVSTVDVDTANFTASLGAAPITWKDVMNNQFGLTASSRAAKPVKRGRRSDTSGEAISLAHDLRTTLYSDANGTSVRCDPCDITGEIDYTIQYGTLFNDYVELSFSNIGLDLGLIAEADYDFVPGFMQNLPLVAVDLPILDIDDVVTFDLVFNINVEALFDDLHGTGKFTTGFSWDLATSSVKTGLQGRQYPIYEGWTGTTHVSEPAYSGQVSTELEAGIYWRLGFSIDVAGDPLFEAVLDSTAPILSAQLNVETDTTGGACKNANVDVGVDFETSLGTDLGFEVDLVGVKAYSTKLASTTAAYSTCFPVATAS